MKMYIKLILLFLLHINYSFTLPEPTIIKNNYVVDFGYHEIDSKKLVIYQNFDTRIHEYINKFLDEFKIIYNSDDSYCTLKTIISEFWIEEFIGSLSLLHLEISGTEKLVFKGNIIKGQVSIPPVYNRQAICSHTGSRRWLIAGPREIECSYHSVQRGLTVTEIMDVKNLLTNKINENKN
jgi:hypothetical protein